MKFLVTGGAGFIGSEFVKEAVKKGFEVCVVDKLTYAGDLKRISNVIEKITFYKEDILNKNKLIEIFEIEKPQIIVHFAAESHVDRSILNPYEFIETNIKGTLNLLDIALKKKIDLFINVSTDEVYGETKNKSKKFKETDALVPNSPYSVSKASADMLGRVFFRTYGLPVITIRPSNNYGPWQYPEKLIPVVIWKAINEEPIPIYGNGKNIREWLYVSDCVEAIFSIIEKGKIGEIYNVGSGEEKENVEVVKIILHILNKSEDLITFIGDRPGHDYRYALDTSKIRNEIGWKPKIKFCEGITRTVEWYLDNIDWLKEKVLNLKHLWRKIYNGYKID